MTITAERLSAFIFSQYVLPARESDGGIVIVSVRQVWKSLDGEFPLGLIRGILGSMRFRNTHHLALVATEGSKEEDPDTYVFKLFEPVERRDSLDEVCQAALSEARPR